MCKINIYSTHNTYAAILNLKLFKQGSFIRERFVPKNYSNIRFGMLSAMFTMIIELGFAIQNISYVTCMFYLYYIYLTA